MTMSKERRRRKPSNANNSLFIYNLSATLEPFLMLQCTLWNSSHDLTHHQRKFLWIQPRHIIRRRKTSDHFLILPNYTGTITPHPPRLPRSPSFCETIPCTPPPTIWGTIILLQAVTETILHGHDNLWEAWHAITRSINCAAEIALS